MNNPNDATHLETLRPGDEIGPQQRRFVLERKLGGGGMGIVWLARDLTEERLEGGRSRKAIKLLLPHLYQQSDALNNLKREALRAARLQHPNVINVLGFEEGEKGFAFIVMEYLEGETLAEYLAREGERGVPPAQAMAWLAQIVAGLTHAHEENTVHRDLKPGNIMLLRKGGLKILDFGLAHRLRRSASIIEPTGFLTGGTAQYMPPETAIHDEAPDKRHDMYALACIGWELFTGAPPFSPEAARMPPSRGYPDCPEGMSRRVYQVLIRGVAYKKRDRPATVGEWFADLQKAMQPPASRWGEIAVAVVLMGLLGVGVWRWQQSAVEPPDARPVVVDEAVRQDAEGARQEAEAARALAAQREQERQQEAARRAALERELAAKEAALVAEQQARAEADARATQVATAPEPAPNPEPPTRPALPAVVNVHGMANANPQWVADLQRQTAEALGLTPIFDDPVAEMPMAVIPAGEFKIGSPSDEDGRDSDEDQLEVNTVIAQPFALGVNEVTVGQFRRFVDAERYITEAEGSGKGCHGWTGSRWERKPEFSWRDVGFEQTDDHPVVCVSWNDVMAYIAWLNGQVEGTPYRLPSEAEWEYAARAGTTAARYWGESADQGCAYANAADRSLKNELGDSYSWDVANCQDNVVFTAPVGRFKENLWGLKDMLGNVWEWTCSVYQNNYSAYEGVFECKNDADNQESPRVLRGGSWFSNPRRVRSAFRLINVPGDRDIAGGVRLARSL